MLKYLLIIILLCAIPNVSLAEEGVIYMCPMHPHITSPEDGHTCPICGMDLVAKTIAAPQKNNSENFIIELPASIIQNSGVRVEKAQNRTLAKSIRAYGELAINERLQTIITSRVEGWIKTLNISAVGDYVSHGEQLYTIHSPDLLLAQRDYLRAIRSGKSSTINSNHKLFTHYELDKSVINQMIEQKNELPNVPYYSKRNGTVSQLNVSEGSYVQLDTIIARLQDYSSLWINANITERDLPYLYKGESASITLPHHEGQVFSATIDYIYPTIDPKTRTGKVRLLVDNTQNTLKVGNYVDVNFSISPRKMLTIPREAIIKNSQGEHVIIALGDGKFEARNVQTGISSQGYREVTQGIEAGDNIVVSGQFMLDSESSMQEALRKLSAGGKATVKASGGAHANH